MKPPILVDFPESFETERLVHPEPAPRRRPRSIRGGQGVHRGALALDGVAEGAQNRRRLGGQRAKGTGGLSGAFGTQATPLLRGTDTLVGIAGLQDIDWDVPKFEIGYWCRTGYTGQATSPKR